MVRQKMEIEFMNGEKEEVVADRMVTKSKRHFLYYGNVLVKDIQMSEVKTVRTIMSNSNEEV